jgi:hypothetical protein
MSMFSRFLCGLGLRDRDVARLDVPPQHDLRDRLAVLVHELGDDRVAECRALRDRAPRLGRDAVRTVVCAQFRLLERSRARY